jgi:hypothetical protein
LDDAVLPQQQDEAQQLLEDQIQQPQHHSGDHPNDRRPLVSGVCGVPEPDPAGAS